MAMSRVRRPQSFMQFSWKNCLHVIFFSLLVSISIYYYSVSKNSPRFPIKVVKVVGANHINRTDVQNSLIPLVSHGFFGVEVDAIKERLMQISWVSQVAVRRVWPDQVLVTVVEKNPIAYWNDNTILSTTGDLFVADTSSNPNLNLPQLTGPDGKQLYVLQYYNRINKLLLGLHSSVAKLELTPGHVWNVTLSNGVKLTLDHKDFLTHFTHFVKVYPKVVGNRASEVDYVDLRYPNGLAVKWKTVI